MRYFTVILLCVLAIGCQPKSTATKNPITEETLQELRDYIRLDVAAGFEPEDTIAANVVEILTDDYDPAMLTPHAKKIARELIAAHKREQASWPETTDCDRLDATFAALERSGVQWVSDSLLPGCLADLRATTPGESTPLWAVAQSGRIPTAFPGDSNRA